MGVALVTKVMAFDIASRCGVAFGALGEAPRATSIDLGKGKAEAFRFATLMRFTAHMLSTFNPDILVYEAPVGGPKTSHFLVGLAACFIGQAALTGYWPEAVHLGSVRRHFLGHVPTARTLETTKAKAKPQIKRMVMDRCVSLGWPVANDDEADALAIWDYACATRAKAPSAPPGGLFRAG